MNFADYITKRPDIAKNHFDGFQSELCDKFHVYYTVCCLLFFSVIFYCFIRVLFCKLLSYIIPKINFSRQPPLRNWQYKGGWRNELVFCGAMRNRPDSRNYMNFLA